MEVFLNDTQVQSRTNIAFAVCMLCYLLGGTVATLMSVNLPVAIPELLGKTPSVDELGQIGAYLNASFIFGWMFGGLTLGIISDKIGRIKTLAFSAGLYGVFTLMTVFVANWESLLVYRFFTGLGVGGVLLISTVYISEIWNASTRPVALGILAVSFPIGIVLTGGLNVLFGNWRQSFWLGIIPILLAFVIMLLPESSIWQSEGLNKKQKKESIFSAQNGKKLLIGSLVFGSVLIGLWAIFSWLPTWVQGLLANTSSDGQKERGLTMMLLGIGGIVGGMFSGFLIKKLGSRITLMLTFSGCFLACLLLFTTNSSFTPIIYLETALLSLFFGISQGSLSSYIPALFSTTIRATATGFCFNIGRFFTATAVFFVGSLVSVFGGIGNALLSFSITFLIALVVVYFTEKKVVE
ncbi:MFS transporter [Arcicella rigui]|uniref:MFS transporter n=1 Tax=Arcicella rigui TaxID=797020 RepID=A0ABU5QCH8_9BACT|nr:MFS transporter [Arcicella rigui]MEA5140277.1 MFS transporter [Arcicella rigui]